MFRKIADRIQLPDWAKRWTRYKRLDQFDRLLDGTFYDHLPYAFYDEIETGTDRPIPLADRRPSSQFRLPRMVARWSARKLFAGRHRPKLRYEDKGRLGPLNALLRRALFWQKMSEAVLRGSVGSVALTFRVEFDGKNRRLAVYLWKAKYCKPSFDEFGELAQLRVSYTTSGAGLIASGFVNDSNGKAIDSSSDYWFIRDYMTDQELTYIPPPKDDWNPLDGFVGEVKAGKTLTPFEDKTVEHKLGFVPGQWFVNLSGGDGVDGDCTWSDAIPNSVELDYTLSQLGRGTRYNAAPQLVVKGNLLSEHDIRGPIYSLQVQAGYKEEDGNTIGEGDAKLLEMSGTGITAGLALIDKLRNYALEIIAAQRKDPDKMKAPMSGRAMEYLDEDSNDLVMDLRSQYGEDGALPLIRKIAMAAELFSEDEVGALSLQWPRIFQPTPDEVFALVQALQIAVDPMGHAAAAQPGQPATPSNPSATGPAKPGKPAVPPTPAQIPEAAAQFLTVEEARAFLLLNLDIAMLDIEDGTESEEVDEVPTSPAEVTEIVPEPTSIDTDQMPGTPEGDADQTSNALSTAAGLLETPSA